MTLLQNIRKIIDHFKSSDTKDLVDGWKRTKYKSNIKHISVLSGKGGTGKSTIALNLALKMKEDGYKVGILDCDITTPNIHKMMALPEYDLEYVGEPPNDKIKPMDVDGLKMISIGLNIPDVQGILWDGNMLNDTVDSLLTQVAWGDLDYIIIDMPPGTSGEFRTISEIAPKGSVAILVMISTVTAKMDAQRSVNLLQHRGFKIIGVVENMSSIYQGDLGMELAEEFGLNFLGSLQFHKDVPEALNSGDNILKDHEDFNIVYKNIMKEV